MNEDTRLARDRPSAQQDQRRGRLDSLGDQLGARMDAGVDDRFKFSLRINTRPAPLKPGLVSCSPQRNGKCASDPTLKGSEGARIRMSHDTHRDS